MAENVRLTSEMSEMRRNFDGERAKLQGSLQELEEHNEELRQKLTALEGTSLSSAEEYRRRIGVLEKQINSNKEFIEVVGHFFMFRYVNQ